MSHSQDNNLPDDGITVLEVTWNEAEEELRTLREIIFVREQNVPPELEWDDKDENCVHLLVRDSKNRSIATSRITNDGHIGRMAVLHAWRNKGVGSKMLTTLINIAQRRQLTEVRLDAQIKAIDFYLKHHFETRGEEFLDANIPHKRMVRKLSNQDKDLNMDNIQQQILGENRDVIKLEGRDDNCLTAAHMVGQGKISLRLFSPNLDPRIYDTSEFIDAVRNLAVASTHSNIQILINDPSVVVMQGHRIIELARRLSSHISIHRADDEDRDRFDCFMVVDETGFIRRTHADRYEGVAEFNNPGEARQLLKEFDKIWERSIPDPELRRLHI